MKKIAVGNLGEFWYGDYKEPFEQLEGAVPGHPVGVVLKADDGKLLCAYCGKTTNLLGLHVHQHGLTAQAYKDEVGLLQKTALVGESTRRKMIAKALRNRRRPPVNQAAGHDRRITAIRSWRTPERRNKTGRCYSQILAVARTIKSEGHRLTPRALTKRGVKESAWGQYWATFEELAKEVGETYKRPPRYSKAQLLQVLKNLATELGRTPTESDVARFGLPTFTTYQRHFGSWSEACRLAGLQPNIPQPLDGELEVAILVAYATHGNGRRVAKQVGISEDKVYSVMHRYGYPFPQRYYGAGRREWAADMARRLAGDQEKAA